MKTNKKCIKYLAGIIDGEGNLGVYPVSSNYKLVFAINNTNKELIDWLKYNYGGIVGGPYHYEDKRAEYWIWNITKKYDTYRICKLLLPFLIVKREICKLCIKAYEDTFHWNYVKRNGIPDYAQKKREEYYQRTLELNQIGFLDTTSSEQKEEPKLKKRKVIETLEEYM